MRRNKAKTKETNINNRISYHSDDVISNNNFDSYISLNEKSYEISIQNFCKKIKTLCLL